MTKKTTLKIMSVLSVLLLLFFSFTAYGMTDESSISSAVYKIIDFEKSSGTYKNSYIFNADYLKNPLDTSSIRFLIALNRFGYKDDYNAYGAVIKDAVIRSYRTTDKLSPDKATPWHLASLGLMACGINPQDIQDGDTKIDLIKDGVWAKSKKTPLEKDGPESLMRGLIVMDAYNTLIPQNETPSYTRDDLIRKILEYQKEDGCFSTTSVMSDCEITAMAVTALAPYENLKTVFYFTSIFEKRRTSKNVKTAIQDALNYLSLNQAEDGSFKNNEKDNIKITGKTITALCSLGIDPQTDSRFIKNGNTLTDSLLTYQNEDGSISASDKKENKRKDNSYAMEALTAYYRFLNGQNPIYIFTDTAFEKDKTFAPNPNLKKAASYYVFFDTFISTDDYEDLIILTDKAKRSYFSSENLIYLGLLKKKSDQLYNTKSDLKKINEQGDYLASPQTLMSSKSTHAAKQFLKQYETFSEYEKKKIKNYELIVEKKNSMSSKTTVTYILIVFIGLIVIAFVIFLAVFFLKSTPVWDYIYMKFFGSNIIVDDFDDEDFAEDAEMVEEEPLPYLANDVFFDYDLITDEEDTVLDDETPLPYIDNDDFFDYYAEDDDGDDDMPEEFEEESPLPYIVNDEFFEYEYSEEPVIDEDDDFRIY